MTDPIDLDALCAQWGVETAYSDIWGQRHSVPDSTKRAVLHAIGALREGGLAQPAPVLIAEPTQPTAPAHCFDGPDDDAHERMFGPAVQLYALRSNRNWGIGDFTDLQHLAQTAAANGADLVGVNPLHALFWNRPADSSPYSPSNRAMLNPLYIDIEAIDEFASCAPARDRVSSQAFQARLGALRAASLVDYPGVAALKHEILELLYRHFCDHVRASSPVRALAFLDFRRRGGDNLLHHALHEALGEHLQAVDPSCWGTPQWPQKYRDARSPDVAAFLDVHRERVEFFQYLQWQAVTQLERVATSARQAGMALGLYRDLAVGVNTTGSEVWSDPSLFAGEMHVGAPPDEFNQRGQDWGLPPWIPQRLAQEHHQPWTAIVRANMQCAGALRIDHVMGLMRLFWIPASDDARAGAYVRYPLEAMLGVLIAESHRARCMVVGEDLGTVPDAVRDAMARSHVLSYRVLQFERTSDGGFAPPGAYPRNALCTFSTHDLPTLHGFITAADLNARDALNLFPDDALRAQQYAARADDRARLRAALEDEGLLPHAAGENDDGTQFEALTAAVHGYLARTPCRLMTFQLEDVFGVVEQVNMPSTSGESSPNWRRKLPVPIQEWERDGRFAAICSAIRAQGRGRHSPVTSEG